MGHRGDDCCNALRRAARDAYREGAIDRGDLILIYATTRMRRFRDEMHEFASSMIEAGVDAGDIPATAPGAEPDLDAWVEFLRQILEIVLDFIKQLLPLFVQNRLRDAS